MAFPSNWRYCPFTETYNAVSKPDEDQVIPTSSPYQVRLYEVPRDDSPSTVDCVILVELDEDLDNSEVGVDVLASHYDRVQVGDILLCDDEQMYVSAKPGSPTLTVTRGYGGTTPVTHNDGTLMEILNSMTEITSGSPATREFRVDYKYSTGLVLFNSAESGYDVRFDYWGLGTPFNKSLIGAPNPLVMPASAFTPRLDTYDYERVYGTSEWGQVLKNRTSLTLQYFVAPVQLPQGAVITKVTLYGQKSSASGVLSIELIRGDRGDDTFTTMLDMAAPNWGGFGNCNSTTITQPVIDYTLYDYFVLLRIDPDTTIDDHIFGSLVIDWWGS